jgi:hypothetical protein
MMLFIPILEGQQPSTEFRKIILFNHEQYLGDEAAFSIGGFKDLKNQVTWQNGSTVSLCMLLKSIPSSQCMSHPQLFQSVEPNASGIVTMVTFQCQDSDHVYSPQNTLEMEIRQVLAEGEDEKVFLDNDEGIWFGGMSKTKKEKFLPFSRLTSPV